MSNLIGRYLKAKRRGAKGINIEEGEYILLTGDGLGKSHTPKPHQKNLSWSVHGPYDDGDFELMPEGWSPTTSEASTKPTLEEVKRRYPIGTKFYCAHLTKQKDQIGEVKTYNNIQIGERMITLDCSCCYGWTPNLMWDGKWAEIVSLPATNGATPSFVSGDWFFPTDPNWGKAVALSGKAHQITRIEDTWLYINNDLYSIHISNVRKATPEEIRKAKGEPDDWCVKVTKDNREVVRKWMNDDRYAYTTEGFYGLKEGKKYGYGSLWALVISTEEFYKKIGHVEKTPDVFRFKMGDKVRTKSLHWQSWTGTNSGKIVINRVDKNQSIIAQKINNDGVWYQLEKGGNWYLEDGLESEETAQKLEDYCKIDVETVYKFGIDPIDKISKENHQTLELYHQAPVIMKRKTSKNKLLTI